MTAEGAVGVRAHVVVGSRDVDVAIEVRAGECLAVIGPNGAGKSTVLEALAGLLPIDAGRIELDGVQVSSPRQTVPAHRRRTGLVAQRSDLFPFLDVVGNVAFGPRAAGAGRAAARQLARDALDAVGVADLATRDPGTLSGGQAQRVAIARALALEPDLLILDEAVSALDVLVQEQILALLDDLQDRLGLSYLFITHDLGVVRRIADDVVVMRRGAVVERGSVARVFDDPQEQYTKDLLDAIPGRSLAESAV